MSNDDWKLKALSISANINSGISVGNQTDPNTTTPQELVNLGVEGSVTSFRAERTYGDDLSEVALEGPKVGLETGLKMDTDGTNVAAMTELSVCKAEMIRGPVYSSVGLNANTGVKIGTKGVQVNLLGFGFTMGVNEKFTFDTPFGSIGSIVKK